MKVIAVIVSYFNSFQIQSLVCKNFYYVRNIYLIDKNTVEGITILMINLNDTKFQ